MLIVKKHCLKCYSESYVWENNNGISIGTVDIPFWVGSGKDLDSAIFDFINKAPDEITLRSYITDPDVKLHLKGLFYFEEDDPESDVDDETIAAIRDSSLEFEWIEVNGIKCCIHIMWDIDKKNYMFGGGFGIGETRHKDKDEGKKELIKVSEKEIKRIQKDFKRNKNYTWFNLTLFFIIDSEDPDKIAILEPERGIFAQLGADTIIVKDAHYPRDCTKQKNLETNKK